ncbi:TEN1 CST complex subunit L homeolog isoform X1 [Xenopus laevis]|nr:TEN1 CST complex subunit L homeolog [Xenopus laevis]XP_041431385.1 TEN1 CST complex subunit L homeolog isoform X1 [Xenopus laevis]XP_041431386.1 TEN1 CST complex subunit L homeolog isoform X1 [Xenopus laevis]BAJ65437.1 CST complex subunit TEN1 [Xenopus laevis]
MLPAASTFYYLWELSTGQVPFGATVRTFGRLCRYDLAQSLATITAQHASAQHMLRISTRLVEPLSATIGSHYLALGELEEHGNLPVLCVRVMSCIDGANLSLLQQAVEEQRKYFRSREGT